MRGIGGSWDRGIEKTALVAVLLLAPAIAWAQVPAPGDLVGSVRDEAGRPVPLALVTASADSTYHLFTDTSGVFHLYRMVRGVYAVSVHKPGYAPAVYDALVFPGERPDVEIVLAPGREADRRGAVRFAASGFDERRRQALTSDGNGWFITAAEIAQRRPQRTTQLLEGVPGIELRRDASGAVSAWGANGTCLIPIFIDGVEVRGIYRIRIESSGAASRTVVEGPGLDAFVRPADIKAIEYHEIVSWIPAPYRSPSTAACGPISSWTHQS